MRVLVTGAAGNLGHHTIESLMEAGHEVRAFDLPGRHTRRLERAFGERIDTCWGDITRRDDVEVAMEGVDAVIHAAALTPPATDLYPERAREVNVDGTRHVLDAALAQPTPPRVLFSSSLAVFGPRQQGPKPPPARAGDPVQATDPYSEHKIACERMLQESSLTWSIFRIGASPPTQAQGPALLRFMFAHSLDSRVEFVHPRDVGLAQARAVEVPEAWNRVLLIGGGPRCQLTNRELLQRTFEAMGIGALPEEAFADKPLYGDWLDTEESQRLLQYQRHTFEDFLAENVLQLGWKRLGVGLVKPLVRRYLLRHSEPYRQARARS